MNESTEDQRAEYVAGLRALADLIEKNPTLPLPSKRRAEWAFGFAYGSDEARRAAIAEAARIIPGRLDKNDPTASDYNAKYYVLTGKLHGLEIELWAERDQVCRRVVTGTREVTKEIPTAVEEVTITEEIVEWVCEPLLAGAVSE